EGEQVAVGAEEYAQAALEPVAVVVPPGRRFAAGHIALLQHEHLIPGIRQVLCRGQPRQSRARYHDSLTLCLHLALLVSAPGATLTLGQSLNYTLPGNCS